MVTFKTVYLLKHPRSGAVRYIGATSTSIFKRLSMHVAAAARGTTPCAAWIRSLLAQGLHPRIEHLVGPTEYWAFHERRYIEDYRADGKRLLNVADGGPAGGSYKPSAETCLKRSISLKARYANDPVKMAERQELARNAARSANGRATASARMASIWSDPKRAAAMRARMVGSKARKATSC